MDEIVGGTDDGEKTGGVERTGRRTRAVPEGAPFEVYDADQSRRAIAAADRIVRFCERHLAESGGGPESG